MQIRTKGASYSQWTQPRASTHSSASRAPHPQPDAPCRARAAQPSTVALPASPPLPGKAATLDPIAPAPVHALTSGRLHPATCRSPLLPSPLPHGVRPLLAHLPTQQAWGQFTDDQKHEMCFKVLQCHPVERKREQHRDRQNDDVSSSELKGRLVLSNRQPSPLSGPGPHPPCPCAERSWPWTHEGGAG